MSEMSSPEGMRLYEWINRHAWPLAAALVVGGLVGLVAAALFLSVEWISAEIEAIWKPLYLGSFVLGSILAALGYGTMRLYWRWHVLKRFRTRSSARQKRQSAAD